MTIDQLITNIGTFILNPVITLMFAVALVVFFWGIVEFMWNTNDATGREQGQQHMFWGIIGMAIMFSVYGLLGVIKGTFGL